MPDPLNHPFCPEQLWNKSVVYIGRALEAKERHDDAMFPFWASLALEFLGKAVLAQYHPALVTDPRDTNSLLGVCGVVDLDPLSYKSIGMRTVLERLQKACPKLDAGLAKRLGYVTDLRNTELHSGAIPFAGLLESSWVPEFWTAVNLLTPLVGKTLLDYVGPDFESQAVAMVDSRNKKVDEAVKKAMQEARTRWSVRAADNGGEEAYRKAVDSRAPQLTLDTRINHKCPVCGCQGDLVASAALLSEKRSIVDTTIELLRRYRTDAFECPGCSLSIKGAELVYAGLPLEIKFRTEELDIDELGEQLAEAKAMLDWEPDYGND